MHTKFSLLFAFLLISILTIVSCKKEDDFGLNFIPESERLNVEICDTFSITALTVDTGEFKTWNQALCLLGEYEDENFGKTTAGFVTQVRIPADISSDSVDYNSNCTALGLTLLLDYKGIFGDKNTKMQINVYEVTSKVDTIKNGKDIDVSSFPLLTSQEIPLTDLLASADNNAGNPLKINFPIEVAQRFLDFDKTKLKPTLFSELFKGLYITVSESNTTNSIIYLDAFSKYSKLELKYISSIKKEITDFNFTINTNCARTNIFKHTNENSNVAQAVINGTNNPVTYVQAMNGARTVVELPYLNEWFDASKIAVNKAQLIIKVDSLSSLDAQKPPCEALKIERIQDGKYIELEGSYGGEYNKTKNEYIFNIVPHIQSVLNGRYENSKLFISAKNNGTVANHSILDFNSENTKLKVTYIKIK